MARILVTGMSGTGKSTLLLELQRRGHLVLDTDYDGWTQGDGTWDEPRVEAFLATHDAVFVQGTVPNQGRFYDRFDHVVLLSAPLEVILERVRTRTNNPYGQSPEQEAAISRHFGEVEPLLRAGATLELDARQPTDALADTLAGLQKNRPAGQ